MTSENRAINVQTLEVYKKAIIKIEKYRHDNKGRNPRYLFLSEKAYFLLACHIDESHFHFTEIKDFMNIEIAAVGLPGVYVGVGEEF